MRRRTLIFQVNKLELDPSSGNLDFRDLCCYVSLNKSLMDVIVLSDSGASSTFNVNSDSDIINLLIKQLSVNKIIGSVAISLNDLNQYSDTLIKQWISLRKSPNDAFSGNFGHDEYELPRIYVTLKLSDGKGFEVQSSNQQEIRRPERDTLKNNSARPAYSIPVSTMQPSGNYNRATTQNFVDDYYKSPHRSPFRGAENYTNILQQPKEVRELERDMKKLKSKVDNLDASANLNLQIKTKTIDVNEKYKNVSQKQNETVLLANTQARKLKGENKDLKERKNTYEKDLLQTTKKNATLKHELESMNKKLNQLEPEIHQYYMNKIQTQNEIIENQLQKIEDLMRLNMHERNEKSQLELNRDELEQKYNNTLFVVSQLQSNMRELESTYEINQKELMNQVQVERELTFKQNVKIEDLEMQDRELNNKNLRLNKLNSDLEAQLIDSQNLFQRETRAIVDENMKYKEIINKLEINLRENENERVTLKKQLETAFYDKAKISDNLERTQRKLGDVENQLFESNTLKKKIEENLTIAEKDINELKDQNQKLNLEKRQLQLDNSKQQERIRQLAQELKEKSDTNNDLAEEIAFLNAKVNALIDLDLTNKTLINQLDDGKNKIRRFQKENDALRRDLYKVTEDLVLQSNQNIDQQKYLDKMSRNQKQSEERSRSKEQQNSPYINQQKEYQIQKQDSNSEVYIDIDSALEDYQKKQKLPYRFIRVSDSEYKYGTKRIIVKIFNGKLVVRVGGGYISMEEFLKYYSPPNSKIIHEQSRDSNNNDIDSIYVVPANQYNNNEYNNNNNNDMYQQQSVFRGRTPQPQRNDNFEGEILSRNQSFSRTPSPKQYEKGNQYVYGDDPSMYSSRNQQSPTKVIFSDDKSKNKYLIISQEHNKFNNVVQPTKNDHVVKINNNRNVPQEVILTNDKKNKTTKVEMKFDN